jgi:hypothetical protein
VSPARGVSARLARLVETDSLAHLPPAPGGEHGIDAPTQDVSTLGFTVANKIHYYLFIGTVACLSGGQSGSPTTYLKNLVLRNRRSAYMTQLVHLGRQVALIVWIGFGV